MNWLETIIGAIIIGDGVESLFMTTDNTLWPTVGRYVRIALGSILVVDGVMRK